MKHFAPISGVACHAGKFVATAGYDNQVILWNADSHTPIARVNHDHLANQCTFSPDGALLASASSDYSARIWDVPSFMLRAVLCDHDDDVEMVSFSPDSTKVASCSRDHKVRVFDLEGRLLQKCVGHEADVISVAWSPSGEELISSSDDGTVRRWSVSDGSQLSCVALEDVETDTLVVTELGHIITGDDEGRITLIEGETPIQNIDAHAAGIKRLVYSATTGKLVSLSYDRTMRIWEVQDGSISLKSGADLPSMIWPRSCAFLSDTKLAFATFGSTYAEFDTETQEWSAVDYQPSQSINSVLQARGGICTIGDGGVMRLNNELIAEMGSLCNFLTECGPHVICGGQMGVVYDALTGEVIHRHKSPLNCGCTFRRDGVLHAAVGTYTGEFIVFRADEDRMTFVQCVSMHENAIKGLASDGETLMGVSADCATAFAAIDSFEIIAAWKNAHTRIANGCAVIRPGLYCSISRDRILRFWNLDGCCNEVRAPHKNSLKCVTATEQHIAIGDYGGRIGLYDLQDEVWLDMVRPTTWGISSITTGSDGTVLASSYDGNIYQVRIEGKTPRVSVALPVAPAAAFQPA